MAKGRNANLLPLFKFCLQILALSELQSLNMDGCDGYDFTSGVCDFLQMGDWALSQIYLVKNFVFNQYV